MLANKEVIVEFALKGSSVKSSRFLSGGFVQKLTKRKGEQKKTERTLRVIGTECVFKLSSRFYECAKMIISKREEVSLMR